MARSKASKVRPSTEGARLLDKWLDEPEHSAAALANECGVAASCVSQWRHEVIRPKTHQREALERLAGIPARAWMTAEERRIAEGPKRRTGTDP